MINFSDDTSQPFSAADVRGVLLTNTDSVAAFYNETSWGQLTITGDVYGWYTLADTSATCDKFTWASQADAAAASAGVDLSAYDYVHMYFPMSSACMAGLGEMSGRRSWINDYYGTLTAAHELGHNLGFQHAMAYNCTSNGLPVAIAPDVGTCLIQPYGDPSSLMGGGLRDLNLDERDQMGWLATANIRTVTSSGTYSLAPLYPQNSTAVKGIRIPHDSNADLLLEFRQPYGVFDQFDRPSPFVNGVIVRLEFPGIPETFLLDNTASTSTFDDAPLAVGRSFYDPTSSVKVTTVSVTSSGAQAHIDFSPNMSPPSLTAPAVSPKAAKPGAAISVSSTASGPNQIARVSLTVDGALSTPLQATDGVFDGSTEAVSGRIGVPAGQVTSSDTNSCAVLTDHTVRCWGSDRSGQLGDGKDGYGRLSNFPAAVLGINDASAVTVGGTHACAIVAAGGVKCWGWYQGSLGGDVLTPTSIPGLVGATAIAAGDAHTCAIVTDGAVVCWGWNYYGQLGDGTTTDSATPVQVSGLSGATAISASNEQTCAIVAGGSVECWGWNYYGQLGDGTTTDSSTPVAVKDISGALVLSAGDYSTCALLSHGVVKCWGSNSDGQLGNGTTADSATPVTVAGLGTAATAVGVGGFQTCALISGGSVRCWGSNQDGELGDGTFVSSLTPVAVAGLTDAVSISLGQRHGCALRSGGTAMCWGANSLFGQLGDGSQTTSGVPVPVSGIWALGVGTHQICIRAMDEYATTTPAPGSCGSLVVANKPAAPDGVSAARGNKLAVVQWNPASDGGSPVTSYAVSSDPDARTCTTTGATNCTVTGLTNGTPYTFKVTATNLVGTGPASTASLSVTPAPVPDAPKGMIATRGNASATVTWTAPANNGSPISLYTVTSAPGGKKCTSALALSCSVSGLANGTSYTFTVTATNAIGTGVSSLPSNAVTPAAAPGAPTGVKALAYDASALVSWSAPAANGSAITGYTVASSPGGKSCTTTGALSCTVPGLVNGTPYTFTVKATNGVGTGSASAPSNTVTPARVPGAPGGVTATGLDLSARVSWSAAAANGSRVTLYTATASPGGRTCTSAGALSCVIDGLTNKVTYSITVKARNSLGTGPASLPVSVTTRAGDSYFALTPSRVVSKLKLQANVASSFQVTGLFATDATRTVPAAATAVTGVLTVSGASSKGWLALTPLPDNAPKTSTINFPANDSRSTGVTVPLSPGGKLSVTYGAPGGKTAYATFDVTGYFVPGTAGSTYVALTPNRILDSRPTAGVHTNTGLTSGLSAGIPKSFQVTGRTSSSATNVPTSAIAVTGTLTVTSQTAAGFMTLEPTGLVTPPTASLYFPKGDNRATGLTAMLGPGGKLSLTYTSSTATATTHVIFDVTGYFAPGAAGAMYVPLTPNRILDDRPAYRNGLAAALKSHTAATFAIANRTPRVGTTNVPMGAVAVTGTLTVTGQTAAGWLALTLSPNNNPITSSLNFPVGDNRATGVTVPITSAGKISITYGATKGATTYAIFDVTGYFVR